MEPKSAPPRADFLFIPFDIRLSKIYNCKPVVIFDLPNPNHRLWWCFFICLFSRFPGIFIRLILPNPNGGLD